MKKVLSIIIFSIIILQVAAQNINSIINEKKVEQIEKVLSADDMQGRRAFTPAADKAAAFIAQEFKKTGLRTLNQSGSYLQSFTMVKAKFVSASCIFDGTSIETKNIIVITSKTEINITEKSSFEKAQITADLNFFSEARKYIQSGKNYLVVVDTAFAKNFGRLTGFKNAMFKSEASVIFVLSANNPSTYAITAKHDITEQKLANVVGILPGKSKTQEYVIFSGHYDHLGVGSPREGEKHDDKDSIYNGANDDAAGTTAVMILARYYKKMHNNERTIIFAAFTAEEVGGFGAQYFSKQFNPEQVIAMFNIEMIGTESKWGANSAYITGFEKTDMGKILQANLQGSGFNFYPDPYIKENLFYRSDNATLARLGVPAHTISTSKMDSEPNYHKVSDEIGTLNMHNMAEIIKAIVISAKGIVAGKETPSRVDTKRLN
ncbi:M28 family metallopeptidase [Parasediminibacterium paludis]|uniref:M28 family metallopeptidase n=1 Tax=Parasediminibacterium paludis TaxID=908966 RepID=A0ABV8PVJ2_9BACT